MFVTLLTINYNVTLLQCYVTIYNCYFTNDYYCVQLVFLISPHPLKDGEGTGLPYSYKAVTGIEPHTPGSEQSKDDHSTTELPGCCLEEETNCML